MVLAGAYYSNDIIPIPEISKLALRLMVLIENQQDELDLAIPELENVQASTIVLAIFACSCDPVSNHYLSLHFVRVLSMVQRLGAFEMESALDPDCLSEQTFNWTEWIIQESQRRLACSIFCLDMARCIFIGDSPALSPLSMNVSLPCYEAMWEAKTSVDCLKMIKAFPSQCSIASALRDLRDCDAANSPLLEISGFGMFALIKGLHGILFNLTREEVMPLFFSDLNHAGTTQMQSLTDCREISEKLTEDFSAETVETIADNFIEKYGGNACRSLNSTLNAWRQIWETREFRDSHSDGTNFSCDPLPFWFLAKVFLMIRLVRCFLSHENVLDIPRGKPAHLRARTLAQGKLNSWLQRFRPHKTSHVSPENPADYVPMVTRQDESRILLLMSPL
ncbi:Fc.00g024120.m01.CDS01 [Cosmosporella sp. VM-42]